jgi:hypothetical protein
MIPTGGLAGNPTARPDFIFKEKPVCLTKFWSRMPA